VLPMAKGLRKTVTGLTEGIDEGEVGVTKTLVS